MNQFSLQVTDFSYVINKYVPRGQRSWNQEDAATWQWLEHGTANIKVAGSSPTNSCVSDIFGFSGSYRLSHVHGLTNTAAKQGAYSHIWNSLRNKYQRTYLILRICYADEVLLTNFYQLLAYRIKYTLPLTTT